LIIKPIACLNKAHDNLIPLKNTDSDCQLRGIAAKSALTVDKFLAITHVETEMK
jgi:hypothetical protein